MSDDGTQPVTNASEPESNVRTNGKGDGDSHEERDSTILDDTDDEPQLQLSDSSNPAYLGDFSEVEQLIANLSPDIDLEEVRNSLPDETDVSVKDEFDLSHPLISGTDRSESSSNAPVTHSQRPEQAEFDWSEAEMIDNYADL